MEPRMPIIQTKKKKGPSRRKFVPIWIDPALNGGDLIISYYIPLRQPEVPQPDEPVHIVNATRIMSAKLPRAMTNAEFHVFEYTEEGRIWMKEIFAKAKEKRKKKGL